MFSCYFFTLILNSFRKKNKERNKQEETKERKRKKPLKENSLSKNIYSIQLSYFRT